MIENAFYPLRQNTEMTSSKRMYKYLKLCWLWFYFISFNETLQTIQVKKPNDCCDSWFVFTYFL